MVWMISASAGRVIVSGALDSWKFRDAAQSGFEKFWQETIATAAHASPASVELLVPHVPVLPGAPVNIELTSRSAALADVQSAGTRPGTTTYGLEKCLLRERAALVRIERSCSELWIGRAVERGHSWCSLYMTSAGH